MGFCKPINSIVLLSGSLFPIPFDPSIQVFTKSCMHAYKDTSVVSELKQLCDPTDYSLPGSSVHGVLQARILKWVAMPSSRGSSLTQGWNLCLLSPTLAGEFFTTSATWGQTITKLSVQFSLVAQSCPTLCDPMNRSMPGLPVHHHLPEFTQTHVHRVGDAIQPSHLLSSPSPPAPNPSQHQSLFQ